MTSYDLSRWTPTLKDVAEDAIGDKLDQKQFPFLFAGRPGVTSHLANPPTALRLSFFFFIWCCPLYSFHLSRYNNGNSYEYGYIQYSARYRSPHWHCKEKSQPKNVPRIIIFIVGGIMHSEMRSACEVTAAAKNWEVIIGKYTIIIHVHNM